MRRERAGQSNIADAHTEVEELKEELGHMREAFARLVVLRLQVAPLMTGESAPIPTHVFSFLAFSHPRVDITHCPCTEECESIKVEVYSSRW